MKYLLSKDDSFEYDALIKAALYGQLEVVKYFVEERGYETSQLLLETLETGALNVFYYLLSIYLESNPSASNNARITRSSAAKTLTKLLIKAARLGHEDVVEYMWSLVNDRTILDSLLISAVQGGQLELLKSLLDKEGRTVSLRELLLKTSNKDIIEFLVEKIGNLNSALIDAVRTRNKKAVYNLLEAGADNIGEALAEARNLEGSNLTILNHLMNKQYELENDEEFEDEH